MEFERHGIKGIDILLSVSSWVEYPDTLLDLLNYVHFVNLVTDRILFTGLS